MACCKCHCLRGLTKSDCIAGLRNLKKRLASHVTVFKFTQLVLAIGGMGLHVYQPFYRSLSDSSLIPGVLCGFIIISWVLLFGHLFHCNAPTRLHVTFSTVAVLGYGWCMSAAMDSTRTEKDRTVWIFLVGKGVVCFAALAFHLLELLYAFINKDTTRTSTIESAAAPTQNVTASPLSDSSRA